MVFVVAAFLWLVVLVGLFMNLALTIRRQRVIQVVSVLASAMRQHLPLPDALQSAAIGHDGEAAALRGIARNLEDGALLSAAIRAGYRECPGYIPAAIEAAEAIHQVPQAVASIERELAGQVRAQQALRPIHPIYPVVIVCFGFLVLTGMSVFVLPRFMQIFGEQGSSMPEATRTLIAIGSYSTPLLTVLFPLLLIAVIVFGIRRFNLNRQPHDLSWVSLAGDWLKWNLPFLHWFENSYSMARATGMLRLALSSGRTVDQAIAATLRLDLNYFFKRRLRTWLTRVQGGEDVSHAALASGLGNSLAWAFETAIHHGQDAPTILENLETFHRDHYKARQTVVRQVFWPCVVLMLASATGFVAYAMISPLAWMIEEGVRNAIP